MDSKKNSDLNLKEIIEGLNHYMDKHMMEVRLSIGALGLIGAGVVLRSIRFATKFHSNNRIPKSFIKKNVGLRGIVKSISTDGTLNVEHIPIIPMPWHRSANNDQLLNLSLEAIRPTIPGTFWLKLNVENKKIWFKIISKNQNDINCIASEEKKLFFKKNLNSELVRRGLAVVQPMDQRLSRVKAYKQLYQNLTATETKAKKSKAGIWWQPSRWDGIRNKTENSFNVLKKLKNLF